jgi:hypothetical protein
VTTANQNRPGIMDAKSREIEERVFGKALLTRFVEERLLALFKIRLLLLLRE